MTALSRRVLLGSGLLVVGAAGVGAGLATTHGKHAVAKAAPIVPTQPDPPQLVAAVRRELDLVARLERAGRRDPRSLGKVTVLVADHRAHAATLTALLSHAVPASTVSPTTARAGDLLRWEKAAAAQTAQASAAAHGALAALLASIAACESSHVAWLS